MLTKVIRKTTAIEIQFFSKMSEISVRYSANTTIIALMRAAKSESIRGVGFFKENYISGNVTDLN